MFVEKIKKFSHRIKHLFQITSGQFDLTKKTYLENLLLRCLFDVHQSDLGRFLPFALRFLQWLARANQKPLYMVRKVERAFDL